jgi:hypothetical protein
VLRVNGKVTKVEARPWESKKKQNDDGTPVSGVEYTATITYPETGAYDLFVLGRALDGDAFKVECMGATIEGPVQFRRRWDEANQRAFTSHILLAYDVVTARSLAAVAA